MDYQFAVKNQGADPNIKLYASPVDAYAELERRLSYGLNSEVLDRHEWDSDVMKYCADNYNVEKENA
jgi:hypothetical protein